MNAVSSKVIGVSKWTSANRASAVHADDGNGNPQCGDDKRDYVPYNGYREVTCKKCLRKQHSR